MWEGAKKLGKELTGKKKGKSLKVHLRFSLDCTLKRSLEKRGKKEFHQGENFSDSGRRTDIGCLKRNGRIGRGVKKSISA